MNRNWIIATLIAFLILFASAFYFRGFIKGAILGPTLVTAEELMQIEHAGFWRHYVLFDPPEVMEGGAEAMEKEKLSGLTIRTNKVGEWLLVPLSEDAFLAVKSRTSAIAQDTQEGFLAKFSPEDLKLIKNLNPELAHGILPFYIDETKRPNQVPLIFGAVALLVVLWMLYNTIRLHRAEGDDHPIKKQFEPHGGWREVGPKLEAELLEGRAFDNLTFTKSWIVYQTELSLKAFPAKELVWSYPLKTNNVWGLVLRTSKGEHIYASMGKKSVQDAHSYLNEWMPHIVLGFERKWHMLWKDNPQTFLDQVKKSY